MHTGSINRVLLISLLLLVSSTAMLAVTPDDIYRQLMDRYDAMEYYAADFEQVNYWLTHDHRLESQGRMYMTGERFALIYNRPAGQRLIIDEAVYLIDDNEQSMIITGIEHTGGVYRPTDVLRFYWEGSEKELTKPDEQSYMLVLIPEDDPYTARIVMKINREDFLLTGVIYQDHQQNSVEFRFFNEQIDRPIEASVFQIPVDAGYTVIDNR